MVVLLAALAALLPQGVPATGGKVVDASGKPVAGATVTFLSRAIPRAPASGPEDRHVVQTGADGSYRVALQPDHRYSAWARWSDGATRCAEGVTAGEFVELRQHLACQPRHVVVHGLRAWADDSLTFYAVAGSKHLDFVPLEVRNGAVDVPALPLHQTVVEARRADGTLLFVGRVLLQDGELGLFLPPPLEVTLRVADDAGNPVADAAIRHCRALTPFTNEVAMVQDLRAPSPVVARTDANGVANLRVPLPDRGLDLAVEANGFEVQRVYRRHTTYYVGIDFVKDEVAKAGVPVPLVRRAGWGATLTAGFREPVAAGHVFARIHVGKVAGGRPVYLERLWPVENGAALFESPIPEGSLLDLVDFEIGAAFRKRLGERTGLRPRHWRMGDPRILRPQDWPRSGLKHAVAVKVVANGMPVPRTLVAAQSIYGEAAFAWTDRKGVALLSQPQVLDDDPSKCAIFAAGPFGYGMVKSDPHQEKVTIELTEAKRVPVRFLDKAGKPVSGVDVWPEVRFDEDVPPALRMRGLWLLGMFPAATDADGCADVLMPAEACDVEIHANCMFVPPRLEWQPAKPPRRIECVGEPFGLPTRR